MSARILEALERDAADLAWRIVDAGRAGQTGKVAALRRRERELICEIRSLRLDSQSVQ